MDITSKSGINLDIGCGENKQDDSFVGIDYRELPGVDIVHNLMLFPWPLPDECVNQAWSSHLIEHLPPFGSDPKLLQLIRLLIDAQLVTEERAAAVLGDWDNDMPGFMRFMDEVWRIMKPGGKFMIAVPHALSGGFPQDPTHINMINENTFRYFDPFENVANGMLYRIYRPKPWKIHYISFNPIQNVEIILIKRSLEELEANGQTTEIASDEQRGSDG